MFDTKYNHFPSDFVNAVDDSERATPCGPEVREFAFQLTTDSMRIIQERPGDQVDDSHCHGFGKLFCKSSRGRPRNYQSIPGAAVILHEGAEPLRPLALRHPPPRHSRLPEVLEQSCDHPGCPMYLRELLGLPG